MVGGWGTPLGSLWVSSIPGVGIVGDIHEKEGGRVRQTPCGQDRLLWLDSEGQARL